MDKYTVIFILAFLSYSISVKCQYLPSKLQFEGGYIASKAFGKATKNGEDKLFPQYHIGQGVTLQLLGKVNDKIHVGLSYTFIEYWNETVTQTEILYRGSDIHHLVFKVSYLKSQPLKKIDWVCSGFVGEGFHTFYSEVWSPSNPSWFNGSPRTQEEVVIGAEAGLKWKISNNLNVSVNLGYRLMSTQNQNYVDQGIQTINTDVGLGFKLFKDRYFHYD